MVKEQSQRNIGMVFIKSILCFIILKDLIIYFLNANELFGADSILPYSHYLKILNAYHLDLFNYPFNNTFYCQFIIIIGIICTLTFYFEILPLFSGLLLFLILSILRFRNIFIMDGGDNLTTALLPLVILFRIRHHNSNLSLWNHLNYIIPYAIIFQVCIVYFFAAIHKLYGEVWINGTAVFYVMRVDEFRSTEFNIPLTQNYYFVKISTYLTIVWEFLFPFLAIFRKTKLFIIMLSLVMHLGILIFMRIDNYSLVIIGTYLVFFTDEEINNFFSLIKGNVQIKKLTTYLKI